MIYHDPRHRYQAKKRLVRFYLQLAKEKYVTTINKRSFGNRMI